MFLKLQRCPGSLHWLTVSTTTLRPSTRRRGTRRGPATDTGEPVTTTTMTMTTTPSTSTDTTRQGHIYLVLCIFTWFIHQDEGKYDKNEDRDRDYYRRRRPAGQGRVSSELQSTGVINEKLSGVQLINLSSWSICIVLLVSLITVAYYFCDDQPPWVWPSSVTNLWKLSWFLLTRDISALGWAPLW